MDARLIQAGQASHYSSILRGKYKDLLELSSDTTAESFGLVFGWVSRTRKALQSLHNIAQRSCGAQQNSDAGVFWKAWFLLTLGSTRKFALSPC